MVFKLNETTDGSSFCNSSKNCLGRKQVSTLVSSIFLELQESSEALKTKMSELRLYCDLLLQQVNKIQESPLAEMTADSEEVRECCVDFQCRPRLLYYAYFKDIIEETCIPLNNLQARQTSIMQGYKFIFSYLIILRVCSHL